MNIKTILFWIFLCTCTDIEAAMLRVVDVEDSRTIVVDRHGTRQRIRLAGVLPIDELRATELLKWTLNSTWILAERTTGGDYLVWRSPDALFINRELVTRGYARPTLPGIADEPRLNVTYLGILRPVAAQRVTKEPERRTGSGKRPRSKGPRAPTSRSRPGSRRGD